MPSEFDTVSTTVTKPSPVLEGSLSAFVPYLNKLMKGAVPSTFAGIDTSVYDPKVAAQDALQKQAAQAASGLTSLVGPDAYKPYMSPYQQEVMDTTMAEFDRQAAIDSQGLRDAAISRGAYGGGREGVMAAEQSRGSQMNRAQLQAQLLNQGFQQAQQASQQDMMAQQGLGTYQSQLGQQQQGFEQAKLDAAQIAAREKQFAPFTQLGLVGQQLAQIQPGAFPTQTVGYAPPAAPASPMSQFLGAGAGIGGMMGKLGLFG